MCKNRILFPRLFLKVLDNKLQTTKLTRKIATKGMVVNIKYMVNGRLGRACAKQ